MTKERQFNTILYKSVVLVAKMNKGEYNSIIRCLKYISPPGAREGENHMLSGKKAETEVNCELLSITYLRGAARGPGALGENIYRALYTLPGECRITIGSETFHLIGNRMMLLRGPLDYRIDSVAGEMALIQTDFTAKGGGGIVPVEEASAAFPGYAGYMDKGPQVFLYEDHFGLAMTLLRNVNAYSQYESPSQQLLTDMALSTLLLYATSIEDVRGDSPLPANEHVRKAIEFIQANYMFNIGAEDIAAYAGIHPNYLHRIFLTKAHTRVLEYLTGFRVKKAKLLLVSTTLSIAEVAHQAGFSSRQYFSKVFRSYVGVTPQEFRNSYDVTCNYQVARSRYNIERYHNRAVLYGENES